MEELWWMLYSGIQLIWHVDLFVFIIQLQWKNNNRVKELELRLRTQTSRISPLHSEITWNIWTIYTPRFFPSLFVFVVLRSDVFAVYYPHSDWYGVYILSPEHSREAHAQSSFNICSNPCSSCRLNGSHFWYFPLLLMLQFRRCAGASHPPVLSMQMLSFLDAQMANKMKKEGRRQWS